ncbi:hypothetical protein [Paenibacillus sp. SI8]|uniref:hypothetical protein n=1 Tax=unclassified Paenibacillus TaxID=185978 RepID=UPI0034658222
MEHIRVAHLKTRVSLVACISDSLTSEAPLGTATTVYLDGIRSKAISKSNGSYIFSDLPQGDYTLCVNTEHYFPEQRSISIGTANSFQFVQLMPLPSYPFSPGTGLIRVVLQDEKGAPMKDASLTATMLTEECAAARLMLDQIDKGDTELILGSLTGIISVGDCFLLRGRSSKETQEVIRIAEVLESQKRFRLENPVKHAFNRGALLLPVQQTRSTERGEAVLAFRGGRIPEFQVQLEIARGASRKPNVLKEVRVAEGTTTNLGKIQLT